MANKPKGVTVEEVLALVLRKIVTDRPSFEIKFKLCASTEVIKNYEDRGGMTYKEGVIVKIGKKFYFLAIGSPSGSPAEKYAGDLIAIKLPRRNTKTETIKQMIKELKPFERSLIIGISSGGLCLGETGKRAFEASKKSPADLTRFRARAFAPPDSIDPRIKTCATPDSIDPRIISQTIDQPSLWQPEVADAIAQIMLYYLKTRKN